MTQQEQSDKSYAIVQISGQQQKVCPGDQVLVPLMSQAQPGQQVKWECVLLVGGDTVQMGKPYVTGSCVQATVLQGEIKGPKVRVFKKKRRKGYHKTIGHRQKYTKLRVDSIQTQQG